MSNFLKKITGPFGGQNQLEAEKARLEAFLSAFPGEYCGWAQDGSVAYSQGFTALLELDHITSLTDIQNALEAKDSSMLENVFSRLRSDGIPFTIEVKKRNAERYFQLSGSRGKDLSEQDFFDVIWLEDKTKNAQAEQKNAESEKKREQIIKAFSDAPFSAWLRNDKLDLIWCNHTYADIFSLLPEDIVEQQKEIKISPKKKKAKDSVEPGRELAKRAQEEKTAQETSAHSIIAGKRLLLHIQEIPLDHDDLILGVAKDVTRQEELESDLARYQATNKELLEQLRTAIGLYNADQQLEFYNTAFSELWELEEQWLNTKPKLGDIMEKLRENRKLPEQANFKDFKKSWLDMFTSLIEAHEDMLYLPDGGALRMLVVPQSAGGLMMTFEDVTSRLELESSYNTLIAVQRETLDNLAEAVSVYGGDGKLKLWNPAFSRLWDLSPDDLDHEPHVSAIVEKLERFFTEEEWAQKREELIAKALDRVMHESRITRKDDVLVDFVTVPLPDGGVLVTYSDVTDTVRVETALRDKNKALEAAEKLKMDFLANVSYQLRTPLNAIIGFNEILDQEYFGSLNDRQREYTHDIKEASHRLLGLIDDILDLSSIEAGYMILTRAPVKIADMLQNVHELMVDWAKNENLKLTLQCPKNIGIYECDERRMKQAIVNLVRNSITFTPSGGEIVLKASRKKEAIHISVHDTGIGISREQQVRIFEPFERALRGDGKVDQAKIQNQSGAGLGLTLVKNIIALHNGEIELESKLGAGTTVNLILPLDQNDQ